jgi:hypothetical protein
MVSHDFKPLPLPVAKIKVEGPMNVDDPPALRAEQVVVS